MSVVLADFGLSEKMKSDRHYLTKRAGTPGYSAPEILLEQPYSHQVDIWSLGVVFFALICGKLPFYSEDQQELFNLTTEGELKFSKSCRETFGAECVDLCRKMLRKDPKKRITIE